MSTLQGIPLLIDLMHLLTHVFSVHNIPHFKCVRQINLMTDSVNETTECVHQSFIIQGS